MTLGGGEGGGGGGGEGGGGRGGMAVRRSVRFADGVQRSGWEGGGGVGGVVTSVQLLNTMVDQIQQNLQVLDI